jgi:ABC-type dipeptide/oligopeptide/nickel transport system permease subunit
VEATEGSLPETATTEAAASFWRDLARNKPALIAMALFAAFIAVGLAAPAVAPSDPLTIDLDRRLQPPVWAGGEWSRPLGSDQIGRDLLSRIIYGARTSIVLGVVIVLLTLLIGVALGSIAGYAGGWIDVVLSRIVDVLLAFPFLVFALGMMAVLGPGFVNLILVLAFKGWVDFYRVARAEVMSLKSSDFVQAARALGVRKPVIVVSEILPNVLPSIIVLAALRMAAIIIAEASLSFLGLGVQPPTPSWGMMVNEGRPYMLTAWWISTFPGFAIGLLVLAINIFGEGLRDALDPRLKRVQ